MSDHVSGWMLVSVAVSQLAFGIWVGWLRWGRCRHEWLEHWFMFDHYEQCKQCQARRPI